MSSDEDTSNPYNQKPEEVPAVIFAVLYTILTIMAWVRFRATKSLTILAVGLFVAVRSLSYVFRAVLSENNENAALQVISGVLLAAGLILIIHVFMHVLYRILNILEDANEALSYNWTRRCLQFSPVAISSASTLSSIGAALLADSSSPSDIYRYNSVRKAGAILYLAIVLLMLQQYIQRYRETLQSLSDGLTHENLNLSLNLLKYVGIPATILLIPRCVWQLSILYATDNLDYLGDPGFYPMFTLSEFFASIVMLWPFHDYLVELDLEAGDTSDAIYTAFSQRFGDGSKTINHPENGTVTVTITVLKDSAKKVDIAKESKSSETTMNNTIDTSNVTRIGHVLDDVDCSI